MLVRLSHLGDVVHALCVFHALHAAYPRSEIAWAIQREFAALIAPLPGLRRVFVFERRGGLAAWLGLRRELRSFAPDWTVDAQGNAKSACATLLSGAPRRTAPARADWQEPWAAWSAPDRAPALVAPARHAMQRMEALVAHATPGSAQPLRTDAALSPAERGAGERALAAHMPSHSERTVLLHLSPPGDVRGWPRGHWARLARTLVERSWNVLLLSGPAEESEGRALAHELGSGDRLAHWVGQRGLRELAAVFEAAARRGMVLVACDSGPMHLAAAHGLAVVVLAGPQDAERTGPWPLGSFPLSPHRVVRSRAGPACAPCLARRCRLAQGAECMRGIEPEDVLAALASTP